MSEPVSGEASRCVIAGAHFSGLSFLLCLRWGIAVWVSLLPGSSE